MLLMERDTTRSCRENFRVSNGSTGARTIVDTFIVPPCYAQKGTLYQVHHLVLINKPVELLNLSSKNLQNIDSLC